ncbi:MAG: HAD family hydrolase [Candidatus Paceibacterota bacterium]
MGVRPNSNKLARRKAVFLDRDGTIIHHVELMHRVADLKFFPQTASAIKSLNRLGFLVVVITNQPVIARGIITPKEVDAIHAVLIERLNKKGARIDAVYFCPHHPNADLKKYRLKCRCRKPAPGLILKALKEFNINPKKSFMIGDSVIDIVAGHKAKLKTILVKTGPGHARDKEFVDIKPNFTSENLLAAVKIVEDHS